MAVAFLKANLAIIDTSANIASGDNTDIDNGVATPSGTFVSSVLNQWTNQASTGGPYHIPIDSLPGDASTVNSVKIRVRARVDRPAGTDDIATYTCDLTGTGAPAVTVQFVESNNTIVNKEHTVAGTPTVAQVNEFQIRIRQSAFSKNKGNDSLELNVDEAELEVDYEVSAGGAVPVTVIPWYYRMLMAQGGSN